MNFDLVSHMQKLKGILYKQSILFSLFYSILLIPTIYISNYIFSSYNVFQEYIVINSLFLILYSFIILMCLLEPVNYLIYKIFFKKTYIDFLNSNRISKEKTCLLNCFCYIPMFRKIILHKLAIKKLLIHESKPLTKLVYSSITAIILIGVLLFWNSYLYEISLIFKLITSLLLFLCIRCITISVIKLYFKNKCQNNFDSDKKDRKKIMSCICNEVTKEDLNKIFYSRIKSLLYGIASMMFFYFAFFFNAIIRSKSLQMDNIQMHYILIVISYILGIYALQSSIFSSYYLRFYFPIKIFYKYQMFNNSIDVKDKTI